MFVSVKRFYSTYLQNNLIVLENEEAQHCSKVLRCKVGEKVEILNGAGILYEGVIAVIQRHGVQINISQILKKEQNNTNNLSIAICPTKNPVRLEWFVEKATEIGVAAIYPIITERTEKATIKHERLQHIIIAAAKQSGQLFFPKLHPIQKINSLFDVADGQFDQYFIAHCSGEKKHLKDLYLKKTAALLLIGPEGDFTPTEVNQAVNKNYIPISLGSSTLRVETAGIVACSIIKTMNDD